RAQAQCKCLARDVAAPREREYLATLRGGHLRDQVRGRPEPIDAQRSRVARQPVRAVADQARAQQVCGLAVVIAIRQGETEARVGERVLRISAIELVAREALLGAEILATAGAVAAVAARAAQPGHTDPHSQLMLADPRA